MPFHPLNGDLVLNANIYATTKYQAQNSYTLLGYSVTNARLDLKHIGGTNLDLGIWTRNLFDKLYDNGAAILVPYFRSRRIFMRNREQRVWKPGLLGSQIAFRRLPRIRADSGGGHPHNGAQDSHGA